MARSSNALPWLLVVMVSGGALVRPLSQVTRAPDGADQRAATDSSRRSARAKNDDGQSAADAKADTHRDAFDMLGEHFGIDLTDPATANGKETLEQRDQRRLVDLNTQLQRNHLPALDATSITTVIATLPDPIDSNVRWLFDPMLDAIQRAASDAHYILDRFYLPDWNPEKGASDHSSEPLGAHERWPGVVLFRNQDADESHPPLLMILLVSETATSGIHQAAFDRALQAAALLRGPGCLDDMLLLGPSFSGSATSMILALGRFRDAHACASFRIVSGGATSSTLAAAFEEDPRIRSHVTYRTTVLADTMLLEGLAQQLLRQDPLLDQPGTIAILREANTAYGLSLDASVVNSSEHPTQIFAQALSLPFPMHISRIRGETALVPSSAASAKAGGDATQRFHALALDEPGTPSDQMPIFGGQLTSSSVELMLANIIDAIRRQHVRAVGLLATDARDKLFLAKQIAEFAPGVMLFTLESDLLFVHPDYNKYVRGMIVASSYPLFSQNQLWTAPRDVRRSVGTATEPPLQQFSSTNSEGVYNALLALIAYNDEGTPMWAASPPLLDYRPPSPVPCPSHGCIPPVWLSVVASDALWPIGYAFPIVRSTDGKSTVLRAPRPAQSVQLAQLPASQFDADGPRTLPVRPSIGMLLVLIAFAVITIAAVSMSSRARWRWRRADLTMCTGLVRAARATRFHWVGFAAIVMMGLPIAWASVLGWSFGSRLQHFWRVVSLDRIVYASVLAAESAAILAWCSCTVPDPTFEKNREPSRSARVLRWTTCFAAAVLAVLGVALLATLYARMWKDTVSLVLYTRFAERVLQLDNGVSPIVPSLLLLLPMLAWALLQLWRLAGPIMTPVYASGWIAGVAKVADGEWQKRLKLTWNSSTCGLPVRSQAIVFTGLLITTLLGYYVGPATIEPVAFSRFLVVVWLLAQLAIALTLAHALYLWSLNLTLLRAIAATPLTGAFVRLPNDRSVYDYLSPAPQRRDLIRPARFYQSLRKAFPPDSVTLPGETAEDATLRADFAGADPDPGGDSPECPWSDGQAFKALVERGDAIYGVLQLRWSQLRTTFLNRKNDDETADATEQWSMRAEEYLAMLLTLVTRQLTARVVRELLFVVFGLALVVLALSSFPIYPLQPLIGYSWVWIAIAVSGAIWVSVTMERDPILSKLTGTVAGVTWNLSFVTKLVVYVGIPVMTLFSTQFPEAGATILRWLTPIQPLP